MVCLNIVYNDEINLKLKSHDISFAHNWSPSCPIILKFCTEHGSDTAVLSAKFQMIGQQKGMLWICEILWDLSWKIIFIGISHTATAPIPKHIWDQNLVIIVSAYVQVMKDAKQTAATMMTINLT